MTPTFAAGLGIVLAAVLVIVFPVANTVISFGDQPPDGGHACPIKHCAAMGGGGAGTPASAKPGEKLVTPAPARARSHGTAQAPAGPAPSGGSGTPPHGGRVKAHYQTLKQWQGAFLEEVTISPPAGHAPANWQLQLTYPAAHILGVWGGIWVREGGHAVLVEPGDPGGQPGPPGKRWIQVFLAVTGSPAPPSGCSFDGKACLG